MAFLKGSQIRPELGRADFSPIERGGAAMGQAYASIGSSIGQGISQYAEQRKQQKEQTKQMESVIKGVQSMMESGVLTPALESVGMTQEKLERFGTMLEDPSMSLSDRYQIAQQVSGMLNLGASTGFKALTAAGSSGSTPAAVQEYEFFKGLNDEDKATFMRIKRAEPESRVVKTAKGIFLYNPTSNEMTELTSGQEEIAAAAEEAGAKTKASEEARVDVERREQEAAKDEAVRQMLQDVAIMESKIDEAIDLSSAGTTGVMSYLGYIRGTPAYKLQNDSIATIKNKLSAKALSDMRAASPTGGAVGQVTEKEWERLGTLVASLDVGIGEEALDKNLAEIKTIYQKWRDSMVAAREKDRARDQPTAPKTSFNTVEDAEAAGLPPGTEITIGGRRAVIE